MSEVSGQTGESSLSSLETISGLEAREDTGKFKEWMEIALEASNAGVWEWDIKNNKIYWDERTERRFGYEPGSTPITYEEYLEHLPEDARNVMQYEIERAIQTKEPYEARFRIYNTDGELRWIQARGTVVFDDDDEPSRIIGVQTDITEQKRVDRALDVIRRCRQVILRAEDETELFENITGELVETIGYEFAWIGLARETPEKVVEPVAASEKGHDYLRDLDVRWDRSKRGMGATGRAVRSGQPRAAKNIRDDDRYEPWRQSLLRHGFESSLSVPFELGDGELGSLNLYASDPQAFADEEIEWLSQLAEDIGFRIRGLRTQEELERTALSLEEKETLLQEIHHRVKNNMQIISSIISLHDRHADEKSTDRIMEECQNRIQSMAMVHDMLYQSNNLAELSFDDYVRELVNSVLRYNHIPRRTVDLTLDVEGDLEISLSQAVPCGLILNELVSNACEHAFDTDRENRLIVELKEREEGLILRVKDNGPGFPEGMSLRETDSVGFDIVRALGNYELDGSLDFYSEPMTTVELTFQLDDVAL